MLPPKKPQSQQQQNQRQQNQSQQNKQYDFVIVSAVGKLGISIANATLARAQFLLQKSYLFSAYSSIALRILTKIVFTAKNNLTSSWLCFCSRLACTIL
jgi:hypothetical protein